MTDETNTVAARPIHGVAFVARKLLDELLHRTMVSWTRIYGPGILGEHTVLVRLRNAGAVCGAVGGAVSWLAGGTGLPILLASTVAGACVAVLLPLLVVPLWNTLRVAVEAVLVVTAWHERHAKTRLRRLRKTTLETAVTFDNAVRRRRKLEAFRRDVTERVTRTGGTEWWQFERAVAELGENEEDNVERLCADPENLEKALRIAGYNGDDNVLFPVERRLTCGAPEEPRALVARTILIQHMVASSRGGFRLLLHAPWSVTPLLAGQGWVPVGKPAGPASAEDLETAGALWEGGESCIYHDARELLEAARRL